MSVKIRKNCITCPANVAKGNYECKGCRDERLKLEDAERRELATAREDLVAVGIM